MLTLAGRAGDAIPILERALSRLPDAAVHYHLAEAYLRDSQPHPAASHAKAAHDLIARAEETGAAIDPELKGRVVDLSRRAADMIRARERPDGGAARPTTGEATNAI